MRPIANQYASSDDDEVQCGIEVAVADRPQGLGSRGCPTFDAVDQLTSEIVHLRLSLL